MSHEEHLCYLRAKSSDIEPEKFIFYDFECTQENGNHVPNFVVAQSILYVVYMAYMADVLIPQRI